jgi:acetyltransferase-like isoleucine patch superfamily enzyme
MSTLREALRKFERTVRRALKRYRNIPEEPRLYRAQTKFRKRYPHYLIGMGSYRMPIVHDWDEGATLVIGNYCSIADEVHIFLGGGHRIDWVSSFPFPAFLDEAKAIKDYGKTRGNVIIGNDVWLASGCTILSGVTIGNGAVVAARAVVARDVPPYAIVAGNPARIVSWRFDENTRKKLLETAWWNWSESEIRQIVSLLCSDDLGKFLAYADARKSHDTTGANG